MRKSKSILNNVFPGPSTPYAAPNAHSPFADPSNGHPQPAMAHMVGAPAHFAFSAQHPQSVAGYGAAPHQGVHPSYGMAGDHQMMGHEPDGAPYHAAHPGFASAAASYPGAQQPDAQNFDVLRQHLDTLAGKLNTLVQSQKKVNRQPSSADRDIQYLKEKFDTFALGLGELKSTVQSMQAAGYGHQELDMLKSVIDENYRSVATRMDEMAQTPNQAHSFADALQASHNEVLERINALHGAIEGAPNPVDHVTQAVDSGFAEIAERIQGLNGAVEAAAANRGGNELSHLQEQMAAQVTQLDTIAEQLYKAVEGGSPANVDFAPVESRLDDINRSILAMPPAANYTDNLERLEARIIDLSKDMHALAAEADSGSAAPQHLDTFAFESHFAQLSEAVNGLQAQMEQVSQAGVQPTAQPDTGAFEDHFSSLNNTLHHLQEQMDQLVNKPQSDDGADWKSDILSEIDKVGRKVDGLVPAAAEGGDTHFADNSPMLDRLDAIIGRVDELQGGGSDDQQISALNSLQDQISNIASQLVTPDQTQSLEPISDRLEGIEQQLNANRDISIEIAAGAAEDAVRKVMGEMPQTEGAGVDQETMAALLEDIRSLGESHKENQGNGQDMADLKATLETIAGRLYTLETNIDTFASAPAPTREVAPEQAPAPVMHAASVEPEAPAEAFAAEQGPVVEDTAEMVASFTQELETPVEPVLESSIAALETAIEPKESKPKSAGVLLVEAARRAELERAIAIEEQNSKAPKPIDDEQYLGDLEPENGERSAHDTESLPEVEAPSMDDESLVELQPNEELELNFDSGDEDTAIEPGDTVPDLSSLVRQANARRKTLVKEGDGSSGTDFLAAARRAAQAAALEASEAEKQIVQKEQKSGLFSSLPNIFRKKAVIIAAAAALLIAVAVPIISGFVGGNEQPQIAQLSEEASDPMVTETTQPQVEIVEPAPKVVVVEETVEAESEIETATLAQPEQIEETELQAPVIAEPEIQPAAPVQTVSLPFQADTLDFITDTHRAELAKGDPLAAFEVARRLTTGAGVEKDLAKAKSWYNFAATNGHVPSQYVLGNFNEKGISGPADKVLAEAWYTQAAEAGHVVAMHNLAVLHASSATETDGSGLVRAYEWFANAADHGVRDSQVNLGIMYAKGSGTGVDLVQSYKWFAIAAKSGDKDAISKRDFIAEAMRPDQLEKARAEVAAWSPKEPDPFANGTSVPNNWKPATLEVKELNDKASIAQAQALLGRLGFDAGPADGMMGRKTRSAIRAFREKSGLRAGETLDSQVLQTLRAVTI